MLMVGILTASSIGREDQVGLGWHRPGWDLRPECGVAWVRGPLPYAALGTPGARADPSVSPWQGQMRPAGRTAQGWRRQAGCQPSYKLSTHMCNWVCVHTHRAMCGCACVCQWVCIHVIQSPCVFVWFSVSPLPGTDPIPAARCGPGVRTSAPGFLSSPLWPQALLRAGAAGEHVCDRTPESASLGVWPCLSPRMLGLPQGPGSCLERALPRRGVSECGRLGGERSLYGSQHSPCYVCQ